MLDPPYYDPSQYSRVSWTAFAATDAGDRKADVHYSVDWAGAAADYRKALRQLRQAKAHPSANDYQDLMRQYVVVTREVWVQDAATHTATVAFFNADPRTRRLVRVKYITLDFATGLPPTFDHTESWRVWELAAQFRAAMEVTPGIKVTDEQVAGRPGYRVDLPASTRQPAWSAWVDRQTGLTLSVTQSASGAKNDDRTTSPYHVRDLRVNQPLPAGTFTVHPDYRVLPHPPRRPLVETMDLVAGDRERWLPAGDLASAVPGFKLVPSRLPPGFTLSTIRRLRSVGRVGFLLVYRRGLETLVSGSGPRMGFSNGGDSVTERIPAFDRTTWPSLSDAYSGVDAIDTVPAGALAGAPAAIGGGIGAATSLQAWDSKYEAGISGDATRSELLAASGTLEPLKAGSWHRPLTGLAALVAVIAAAVAAVVTAWRWLRERRAAAPERRLPLSVLTWPLIGSTTGPTGACAAGMSRSAAGC